MAAYPNMPRPEGSVTDIRDIEPGTKVYYGYGLLTPFIDEFVIDSVKLYKDFDEFDYYDKDGNEDPYWANLYRYSYTIPSLIREGAFYTSGGFASDCNCQPDYPGHNANYLFTSKEDAEKFVESVRQYWIDNPDAKAREEDERNSWLEYDQYVDYDMPYDDYDYDMPYDDYDYGRYGGDGNDYGRDGDDF